MLGPQLEKILLSIFQLLVYRALPHRELHSGDKPFTSSSANLEQMWGWLIWRPFEAAGKK